MTSLGKRLVGAAKEARAIAKGEADSSTFQLHAPKVVAPMFGHPVVARLKRSPPVLMCGKCAKRADHGSEIKEALKAEMADEARLSGRKRRKLVKTSCMGVCPKNAIAVASGLTLARGEMLVVRDASCVPAAFGRLIPCSE